MDRVMYGTTSEPAAVTVNNNAITVAIDSAKVTWVVDRFTVADSVGGLGAAFFLSKVAAVASQVQVWLDNTHQEPPTLLTAGMFTVSNVRDKVTLNGFTLGAGEVLVIRYLGYVAAVSLADVSDAGAGADDLLDVDLAGAEKGDIIQFTDAAGGLKWKKVTPVSVEVITDVQWDTTSHKLQKKTKSVICVDSGDESAWTDITNGDGVDHSTL